jgi:hypothetical protein
MPNIVFNIIILRDSQISRLGNLQIVSAPGIFVALHFSYNLLAIYKSISLYILWFICIFGMGKHFEIYC